eukprot:5685385-Amphidinium_carterae.1
MNSSNQPSENGVQEPIQNKRCKGPAIESGGMELGLSTQCSATAYPLGSRNFNPTKCLAQGWTDCPQKLQLRVQVNSVKKLCKL